MRSDKSSHQKLKNIRNLKTQENQLKREDDPDYDGHIIHIRLIHSSLSA